MKKNVLLANKAWIDLEGYYVKSLSWSVRDDLDKSITLSVGRALQMQPEKVMVAPYPLVSMVFEAGCNIKDPSKYKCELSIESVIEEDKDEQIPYNFNLKLVGFFSVVHKGTIEEEELDRKVHYNAVMILYSTARELLASATSRSPFPAVILPTLTFDIVEEKQLNKKPKQLPKKSLAALPAKKQTRSKSKK